MDSFAHLFAALAYYFPAYFEFTCFGGKKMVGKTKGARRRIHINVVAFLVEIIGAVMIGVLLLYFH
jgi:hypothetical protein